ncbi:MarR family winged helix-turn-helix transcriptional regulator [Shewanella sp. SR44-3]|uniref:MarR family winged helix-turn-helix transcriptional regulator n=1 Tax=Shewanella sp. SR44-3 TaxID=2760936 RepID=UPI0015FD719C|nr:MarR family winged helix-turn-helix transcriptional regulator [Shewanella sp. SR44-3]MBB1269894.1 winged helix-turn-helix transcriptional regulator [Shewanella sp. SR44-3]
MTMDLHTSLIKLQRLLSQTWGNQVQDKQQEVLSASEFEYLHYVHVAESAHVHENPIDDADIEHDSSSHMSAIAAEMQVQKSSASLMVNKLEKRGLIERVTCQFDARAQHILFTDKGRELYLSTEARVYLHLAGSFKDQLDADEYQQLEHLLGKACNKLG